MQHEGEVRCRAPAVSGFSEENQLICRQNASPDMNSAFKTGLCFKHEFEPCVAHRNL